MRIKLPPSTKSDRRGIVKKQKDERFNYSFRRACKSRSYVGSGVLLDPESSGASTINSYESYILYPTTNRSSCARFSGLLADNSSFRTMAITSNVSQVKLRASKKSV